MARSKNGQAIRESQRTPEKLGQLKEFFDEAEAQSDLATWRRGRAVLGYCRMSRGPRLRGRSQLLARRDASSDVVACRRPTPSPHLRTAKDRPCVRRSSGG